MVFCASLLLQIDGTCGQVMTWREALAKQQALEAGIRNEARDNVDFRTRRDRRLAAKRIDAVQRRTRARTAAQERIRQREFDRAFSMNALNYDSRSGHNEGAAMEQGRPTSPWDSDPGLDSQRGR